MIKVAVTTLCDFTARTGDLDHRYTPSPSALEGIQGHRVVSGKRHQGYRTEVPIEGECNGLTLSGRADGYEPAANLLEEIKTHRGDIKRINPGLNNRHWAQLKVYGALFCRQNDLPSVNLKLVYYNIVNGEERTDGDAFNASDLWDYLQALCAQFHAWALQEQQHRQARDQALGSLKFPFPDFRRGQRDLSEMVYKGAMTGKTLVLEAPTGSGKTVGTIYPALMAMPRQDQDRLFYLSSRNTGRALALGGFQQLLAAQSKATPLRILEMSSREQACVYPDKACHGESCPLAKGFYDRLVEARQAAVDCNNILDHGSIQEIARRHEVCPYYLSQELARWADVVAADVNYFFDLHAMLFALSRDNQWKTGLLVDEAHNLPDRARAMYSISLSQQSLFAVKNKAPAQLKKPLASLQRSWRKLINNYLPEPDDTSRFLDKVPSELMGSLNRIISAISDYLSEQEADIQLQELLFEALAFTRLAELFNNHSVCEVQRAERGRATLSIHNLIPADFLAGRFAGCHSTALFSATLTPYPYYRDLLGLPADSVYARINSPFSRDQLEVRICSTISTRLKDRDQSINPVVDRIVSRVRKHPANYLVYLSSFSYLEKLYEAFVAQAPDIPTIRQFPGRSQEVRQQFLDSFVEGGLQVGFAVLGGIFSEGIDLPGDRLSGVFILTLGLPPHDEFHEILRQTMQQRFGHAYEYTYLYPGLRKVVQAAGRVIRTPNDTGCIELIDDRFSRAQVRALLPAWWPQPG